MSTSPYSGKTYGSGTANKTSVDTTKTQTKSTAPKTAVFNGNTYAVDSSGTPYGKMISTTNTPEQQAQLWTPSGSSPSTFDPKATSVDTTKTITPTDMNGKPTTYPGAPTVNLDVNSALRDANAKITQADINAIGQESYDKQTKDTNKMMEDLFAKMKTPEQNIIEARQQSGRDEAQKILSEETGKLKGIINKGEADKLSLVGQGRGIPEAIIGGQQAQIARETAIQALPVMAAVEVAQGNYQAANELMGQLFTAKSQYETQKLNFGLKMIDTVAQNASKKEELQLGLLKDKLATQEKQAQDAITKVQSLTAEATKYGLTSSATSALNKIDYSKPTAFNEASAILSPFLAKSQNEIRELKNGNTVLVNKTTGNVISNIGGGAAPKKVIRMESGIPVSGYTIQKGDSSDVIARLYGSSINEIQKINPNIKDWNNLQIGQIVNVPTSKDDLLISKLELSEGGKALTDTSIQKLDKARIVLDQIGVLQKNIEKVKTGPITGAFKGANPWDTNAQVIKSSLNAIIPNLARGVYGEVGVLTDNDIATYAKTIPSLKSTEEIRNAVLYITLDMISKSIENTLTTNAAAGRDVSGFVDIYKEMQNDKNSILSSIPDAQVPQAFKNSSDDNFLEQFNVNSVNKKINNNDFFSGL